MSEQPTTEAESWKPCPFCGGTDIRHHAHPGAGMGSHRGETVYSMRCYNCGATFPNRYRLELLRDNWNRRSSAGARAEQDAARYQFLRGLHDPGPNDPRVHTLDQQTDPVQVRLCFGDDLDAAVDAAMRQP